MKDEIMAMQPQKSYIESYLQEFIKTGTHGMLYKMMLSDKQWDILRDQLHERGFKLIESDAMGQKTISLAYIDKNPADVAAKRAIINKKYPLLDEETVDNLLIIPMASLGRGRIVFEIQYSRTPYDTLLSDFNRAHEQILCDTKKLWVRYTDNWTFVAGRQYVFDEPAYVIGANVDLNGALINDLNGLIASDGTNVIKGYKIPAVKKFSTVIDCHAPLLMYLKRRDANIERKIVDVATTHIRSTRGSIGQQIIPGMFVTQNAIMGEPWYEESQELLRILSGGKVR